MSDKPGTDLAIDMDVPVETRDRCVLRANVFRPESGACPVILTMGPYGKDIHFDDFNSAAYATVEERGPHMNWETVNPEWWVPQGYAVVRVDQRGTGQSPGRMELQGTQEYEDLFDVVEWAAQQPWSTGKVALMGISYYAMNQWHVAPMKPRGLAAIVPWEGAVDLYREWAYHGGILSNAFTDAWYPRQITGNQHGLGGADPKATLPSNDDLPSTLRAHPLDDDYYAARRADLAAIEVPLLSSGNWGGFSLHLRGNIEGYLAAGSKQKWLEVHSGNHFAPFYSTDSRAYQLKFLDHFLKDADNGWTDEPSVKLFVRDSTGGQWRYEHEWPIPRTEWTSLHLDSAAGTLSWQSPGAQATATYDAMAGPGLVFETAPLTERVELTGPSALSVWVSTTGTDLDLFATVDNVAPDGSVVTFEDASGMAGPVVKGWLRASHRTLDEARSLPYRPFHTHDQVLPLTPEEPVELVVEIMPTSMVFEPGHRIRLTIRGCDDGETTRMHHNDKADRDPSRLAGTATLYSGPERPASWLVPVIPGEA